ncbi:anaphase-promoting complex subunit 4 isoform X2 [Condylostylus longicornis]|uniref:anaphase-promoting complex subunit 4 isoform X2 n=1 Tax=Condylostylus longicornis TaxID=2530218 RepID=UPI00244E31A3|nr:anaphase-promoting complex subunit 4 isoform X2 [Condylostylus longicornis]
MAQINSMKQISARNMGFRVNIMKWSNKMDLIAIVSNDKAEVIIQRLNWQKICTFLPSIENVNVKAISWQPDETIIAVAYSNGKVVLFDVEKDDEIYSFDLNYEIETLHWTKPVSTSDYADSFDSKNDLNYENYLPPLPNLNSLSSSARRNTINFSKGSPSFLIISLVTGEICISVLGVLPCGTIDIKKHLQTPNDYKILDVQMGSTFDEIILFVKDGLQIKILVFKNNVLSKYIKPLLNLARKHGHILETLSYIKETIQCIVEAWETVLLEMDNKLTKYANSQPEGTISADFLELLMFGVATPELEKFLTRDLTEKGLKKLGTSIELSYSTIQNLVVKPLHSAAVKLFFHLNTIKGLSENTYFYKDFLTVDTTEKAISSAGSFLLKILELQQTIDQSVTDYKIFWCWLSVVIVRLLDEPLPDDVAAVTQEDITYLAEFLNNFDDCIFEKDGTQVRRKFNLERVGQYLEDSKINFPQKCDNSQQWNKLLNENECLQKSKYIFSHHADASLIQEHNALKKSIHNVFIKPNESVGELFKLKSEIDCNIIDVSNFPENLIKTSFFINKFNQSDLLAISVKEKELIFIEMLPQENILRAINIALSYTTRVPFGNKNVFNDMNLKDLQFYNETTLSMLVKDISEDNKISHYFIQFPIDIIKSKCVVRNIDSKINLFNDLPRVHILDILDVNYFKPIDGNCNGIAVSGSRKVASILSDNCKKVRIYEMEIEYDDDEEVDMSSHNNTLMDNSKDSIAFNE